MKYKNIGNVLMVANYPSDTAYAWWLMEHFWKTLAEWVQEKGGKVFLAYPKITTISEAIKSAPIQLVELTIPWSSQKQSFDALSFIRKNGITSIYFTDQPFFRFQYLKLRFSGVRHIIIHDHTPGDRPYVGGLKGALKVFRNSLPWCNANYVMCVSELMRQRNMLNSRISGKKCIVVQNGIVPVICKEEPNAEFRKNLNLKPNSILIVTSGRAHPYKRFDFIVRCARTLKSESPGLEFVFLLIGDGPAMPDLKKMVCDLELEASVHLLGFRSDVRDILCESDIALHAALGEGFSLSIVEYMSAGLPVIVPDIPSVSQAIKDNETGLIYSRDDVESVVALIRILATDSKRRREMGAAARDTANNEYTIERCTKDYILALNKIWA